MSHCARTRSPVSARDLSVEAPGDSLPLVATRPDPHGGAGRPMSAQADGHKTSRSPRPSDGGPLEWCTPPQATCSSPERLSGCGIGSD